MIHQADIKVVQYRVGQLRVDPLQIKAEGGPLMPVLLVPVELDLDKPGDQLLVLDRLQAELWTRPQTGPRVRLGLPVVVDSAANDPRRVHSLPRGNQHHLRLRIDLLESGLRLLDAHVQGTTQGPILLTLYLDARIGLLEQSQTEALPSLGNPPLLSVRRFWSATVDELEIQLPREHWAQEVAPALGHDHLRLIAVEMPQADGPLGAELIQLFDAASRAYDAADWRETVQKCRDVRNHIEQHVRAAPDERLYQVIAARVGAEQDDTRVKFLDEVWVALAKVASEAHHIQSIGRLDAATAHATLLLTATMIQYLAELLPPA